MESWDDSKKLQYDNQNAARKVMEYPTGTAAYMEQSPEQTIVQQLAQVKQQIGLLRKENSELLMLLQQILRRIG